MAKQTMHAIDIQRFMDALKIEGRSRKRLLKLGESLKAIYEDGRKPTADELQRLRRAVRRWIKTTKIVAGVLGEAPKD